MSGENCPSRVWDKLFSLYLPFGFLIVTGVGYGQQAEARREGQGGQGLFTEKVRPVLELQCLNCHGGKFKQAGLSMVSRDTLLKGSDNGPVVIAGNAANSLLVKKLKHEHEPGMPYKAPKLAEDVIGQIVAWINAGVPYDGTLKLPAVVTQGVTLRHGSDHWAYQVPKRPAVPAVKNRGWVRNPIDAFVAAEHEKRGLTPLAEADPRTLLRRLYLDLIGLPPTVEEINAFLGGPVEGCLREGSGQAAGESEVRGAVGSALDGYLALHRLIRRVLVRVDYSAAHSGIGETGSSNLSTRTRATTG